MIKCTPKSCFLQFSGSKMISVVHKNSADQVTRLAKPKTSAASRSPINEFSLDQKFWARIGNSVAIKSVHSKAVLFIGLQ